MNQNLEPKPTKPTKPMRCFSLRFLRSLLFIPVCLAHAQLSSPPLPPPAARFTNYFAVAACDGTNFSAPSDEVAWTNGRVWLTFRPSPQPGVTYVLLSGIASGHYLRTNAIGTNLAVAWPLPGPPAVPPVLALQTSTDLRQWSDVLVLTGSLAEPARFYRLKLKP
jgi:hypothetical protein